MLDVEVLKIGQGEIRIKLLSHYEKTSENVAHSMYEQYALECYRDEQPRVIFGLGHEYEFMSGLIFRWHEDTEQGQVIDFSLTPQAAQKRPEVLLDIVRLLKQTGIHEEATLLKVRRAIEEILAGSARAQSLG